VSTNAIFKRTMRQITARNFIILVILLIAVWVAVLGGRYSRVLWPEAPLELIPENVDLTLKNIKYTKTRDGEPLWTLIADSAAHSMDDSITRIKNVRMIFYDKDDGDVLLTAESGELIPEYSTVTVSTNVVVKNPKGNTLKTDFLEYKEAVNILQTDRIVTIIGDHFVVYGKGMTVDVDERTLVLLSDVKAELRGMDSY
jgi:LPS export ABC transporter protein LptC